MEQFDTFRKPVLSYLLSKKTGLFIFSFFSLLIVAAQTTNISGVVNTYHKVIEVVPAKACLRVADPTGLNINNLVMVVQMKGASINTSNNSSFGDTTSLNGAGNYEIGTICYIIGDSIFLFHDLLNSYDVSAKVQLVQFAEYYSANVVDTVKALSWDSATSLGGVIAIYADEDITLNAPIYADSAGYAGGVWYNNSSTCNIVQQAGSGYAYDITSTSNLNGAYKGESVANISATQNAAKGAPANGGGGGNNHNNSGGGGANLSAGGNGGGNSSTGPVGCNTGNNYGRAGKALSSWSGKKIFMGGGAGAGHANNGGTAFNYGGNGGGIVFIWANNLMGNGHTVSARGGRGGDSQADGAGGGGAGGTVIMHVTNYAGSASVNVNGGNGGDSYDDISIVRCFGGGGGGSAGAVYFTGATPGITVSISAGAGGQEYNRNPGCNTAVPGVAGNSGQIIPNYTFPRSMDPAGYCLLLLPSKLLYFNGQIINQTVVFNWQVDHPELVENFTVEKKTEAGWVSIDFIDATGLRFNYSARDPVPSPGNNYYRLKVTEKNDADYYSETRKVWAGHSGNDFILFPNPASHRVFVRGNFAPGMLLRLTDISGKLIWQKTVSGPITEILLPKLQRGLYLVHSNRVTKKLVIR